jgi:hypothetical protein
MTTTHVPQMFNFLGWFAAVYTCVYTSACGAGGTRDGGAECVPGDLGCACLGRALCRSGLVCRDDACAPDPQTPTITPRESPRHDVTPSATASPRVPCDLGAGHEPDDAPAQARDLGAASGCDEHEARGVFGPQDAVDHLRYVPAPGCAHGPRVVTDATTTRVCLALACADAPAPSCAEGEAHVTPEGRDACCSGAAGLAGYAAPCRDAVVVLRVTRAVAAETCLPYVLRYR